MQLMRGNPVQNAAETNCACAMTGSERLNEEIKIVRFPNLFFLFSLDKIVVNMRLNLFL